MVEFEPITPEQRAAYLQEQIRALRRQNPAYSPSASYAYDVSKVFGGHGPGGKAKMDAFEEGYNRREVEMETLQGQLQQLMNQRR